MCQRRRRTRQTGDCLKVNWQQRTGDGWAWGRGWWAEEGRGGSGFEGALCRGQPFEVMARILGLKSRNAGDVPHPSLKREIAFGRE